MRIEPAHVLAAMASIGSRPRLRPRPTLAAALAASPIVVDTTAADVPRQPLSRAA